jgi:beta-lactamase superfamily II metal-dependent hydrolase
MIFMARTLSVFILVVLFNLPALADSLHIRVLNVGEGQAVLLQRGEHAVLVDTGHAGQAGSIIKRMHALGIHTLDYLFLTHLHPDHASGLFRVQEAFPRARVRDNCSPIVSNTSSDMIRWVDEALKVNPLRQCVTSGDIIDWGPTTISILWPMPPPAQLKDLNHTSLVLEITHAERKLLIMGDADRQAERTMLKEKLLGPVEILVVGHHGAKDASSDELLQTVQPQIALISTNSNNQRGYPSDDTIKRLKLLGSKVYTTYEQGELHFVFGD